MQTWKSLLAMSLLLGGCGGGGGDDDDTVVPDANPDVPDANPVQDRHATVAITDVALTSDDGVAQGWKGGSISIAFEDLTQGGGEIVFGTGNPIGACDVVRYDATHPKHPIVDAGTFNMSGDGFLKTVGPCSFQDGVGYTCISNAGAESIDGTSSAVTPFVTYEFSGTPFAGEDVVGSYLSINGFTDTALNTGAQPRPILVQTDSTLTVLSSGTDGSPATAETATAQFAVINGAGPIPTNAGLGTIDADFLGGSATSVTITKGTTDEWGAIGFSTDVRGEGFALDDASTQPHEFPDTAPADPIHFTCGGTGGDCGEEAGGPLQALIISGRTTDTDVSGLPFDFMMPPPTTSWAEFQCVYLLASTNDAQMPVGAIQAILDTAPTRIETRILRVAGENGTDNNNVLNTSAVLVGHALVGHTTMPPN